MRDEALRTSLNAMLSPPKAAVKDMLGYKAALATPMLALAEINCCSACRTSGLASNKLEGNPAGGVGGRGRPFKASAGIVKFKLPANRAN